jgi:hypothetical protein
MRLVTSGLPDPLIPKARMVKRLEIYIEWGETARHRNQTRRAPEKRVSETGQKWKLK